MTRLRITREPPAAWSGACEAAGSLVHSDRWQSLLSSAFGAEPLYAWDEAAAAGAAITVFKAGPFRIGYVGFPAGGGIGAWSNERVLELRAESTPILVHLIRLPVSAFGPPAELASPVNRAPESAIGELAAWNAASLPKRLRQNVKRAVSAGLRIVPAEDPDLGRTFHELYHDTVVRWRGGLRYNVEYFRQLIQLSRSTPTVRCLTALRGDEVAAFVVLAQDRGTAYCLHSGTRPALKQYLGCDLLFHEAISWAQREGMACFNMMSSPPGRPTLVRYKEKWGATTRDHCTYEVALRPVAARIFRHASRVFEGLQLRLRT